MLPTGGGPSSWDGSEITKYRKQDCIHFPLGVTWGSVRNPRRHGGSLSRGSAKDLADSSPHTFLRRRDSAGQLVKMRGLQACESSFPGWATKAPTGGAQRTFCSRVMRRACPVETEMQDQQAMVSQTKGGNVANQSTGGVQDLTWSSSMHCSLLLPSALCTEGKTEPKDVSSRVPGPGSVPCNTMHTQSGGWGQLQHKDSKSMATMLIE